MRVSKHSLGLAALLPLLPLLALYGCKQPSQEDPSRETPPFAGLTVRLQVVDDPPLAAAINRFRGQWKAETGAELEVVEASEAEVLQSAQNTADALIVPSYLLGPLAVDNRLLPVPQSILKDELLDWDDIFESLRQYEVAWDSTTYAVPLGSPGLTLYCRADLLARFQKEPPRTWSEYQQLAEFFHNRQQLGEAAPSQELPWCGTVEPLAPGFAGLTLLARAAAYARHPDYFSTLFDIETMQPLIGSPPFERALTELVAAAKTGPADPLALDPWTTRSAFWRGECAMALGWPTRAVPTNVSVAESFVSHSGHSEPLLFELPGAQQVYQPDDQAWGEPLPEVRRVPLLAAAGRLGVVSKTSKHPDAAFHLLALLASPRFSSQISPNSGSTTLFRTSHTGQPRPWIEETAAAAAGREYTKTVRQRLAGRDCLLALRIPGRARYLAALDRAVARAVKEEATPAQALSDCAKQWDKITEELGRDRQRGAYRQSVIRAL